MEQRGPAPERSTIHALGEVFLGRIPVVARLLAAAATVIAAIAWGIVAVSLHDHYRGLRAGGEALGPLAGLFADAASPLTAWPGWAAAALFSVSARRLRRGQPEPPAGRGNTAAMTIAELRAGLRREYSVARSGLLVVAALAALDFGRVTVTAAAAVGDAAARDGLGWMVVEVAGLLAATAALTAWALGFRTQLQRIGAL